MKRHLREANATKGTAKPQPTAPDMLALEAARLKIAQRIPAKAKPTAPQKVEAIPKSEGHRQDNSPYRKEPRQ